MAGNEESSAFSKLCVTECHIAKLADKELAAIFKHLPPFERLIVSEVCSKWRDLSKTPWRDVAHLDLSQVPTQSIHAVMNKCPNLTSVSAKQQNLGDLCRFFSRLGNVESLKCIDCTFTIDQNTSSPAEVLALIRQTRLSEFLWHNCRVSLLDGNVTVMAFVLPVSLPSSLQRLQLSALHPKANFNRDPETFHLPALQTFIMADVELVALPEERSLVESSDVEMLINEGYGTLMAVARSEHLREVYLHPPLVPLVDNVFESFRHLEILFLNLDLTLFRLLERLMTRHPTLRVVVITAAPGCNFHQETVVPVRKLFPDGFNAQPVPQLHLFLGRVASKALRFHPSPTDALKIYPIDAPLPEFLEKAEIKPIFEGSWIASRIKEGTKIGANLTDYSREGNAESILYI